MSDIEFEELFAGGDGGIGLIPSFKPDGFRHVNPASGEYEGFARNGDGITIDHTTAAQAVTYKDKAGTVLWSVLPSNIHADADQWMSFRMDYVDSVLYVVAWDVSTRTLYTATINAAGAIVLIGSAALATDLVYWAQSTSIQPSLSRSSDGSGNLFLHHQTAEIEIDVSNGDVTSEVAVGSGSGYGYFKHLDHRFNFYSASTTGGTGGFLSIARPKFGGEVGVTLPGSMKIFITDPMSLGLPSFAGSSSGNSYFCHLEWGEHVVLFRGGTLGGHWSHPLLRYLKAEMQLSYEKLLKNFNII